jgi:hypothetical protein
MSMLVASLIARCGVRHCCCVLQDPQLAAVLLGDDMAALQDLLRSTYQVGPGLPCSSVGGVTLGVMSDAVLARM